MKLGTVDYVSSYFKYKTPKHITGLPTHKSLKRFKKELQANTISIESDLGGGNHGYLGLLLIDEECATIPIPQIFLHPTYQPPLEIPETATAIQALHLKETHAEAKISYSECKNIEN